VKDNYILPGTGADSGTVREFLLAFQGGKIMSILVGIDGTSGDIRDYSGRNASYDDTFRDSFVRRLCKPAEPDMPTPNKIYLRGPTLPGQNMVDASREGHNFIHRKRRGNEPILLTGYSRGAAGVVDIAQRLQRRRIPVKAMLLFDCVDRHALVDSSVIPDNVEHVLHVLRSPLSRSRESFGNSARISKRPDRYREENFFHCTHAGMGGVPWTAPVGQSPNDFIVEPGETEFNILTRGLPLRLRDLIVEGRFGVRTNVTYVQDAVVSPIVWFYVLPFIIEHGFQ
jgi:hypothetical protein